MEKPKYNVEILLVMEGRESACAELAEQIAKEAKGRCVRERTRNEPIHRPPVHPGTLIADVREASVEAIALKRVSA